MATYTGYDPTSHARLINTTLAHHMTEIDKAFQRNFVITAQLIASGRVEMNCGGQGMTWPVQYRIHDVEGNTGETQRNFARRNLFKTAALEYRGYQTTDAIFKRELRANRGKEAIVQTFKEFIGRLETSLLEALGPHFFLDGSATGRTEFWHGLESMFGTNGTINESTGAQRATNAADLFAYPSQTYAGLSTVLGNYGGANETGQVWPSGLADRQFDFYSPVIAVADTTHADIAGSANTFAGQGDEVMRNALIQCQRNATGDQQVDTIMLSRDFYRSMLNLIDDKERILVNRGQPQSLTSLGFKNAFNFDGAEVTWEAGVPTATGYGYNLNSMGMKCMDANMFEPEGPEYDIHTQAHNAVVSTLSNLRFKSPRNFFKIANNADIT